MDKSYTLLTQHNLSFSSLFKGLKLHFLDLGAAHSLDNYLFPLLFLDGDKYFIDGRAEADLLKSLHQYFESNNVAFRPTNELRFHTISSFVGETKSILPFFYNTSSPTSSTFYPILDQSQIDYSYYPKEYSVTPLNANHFRS